MKAIFISAVMLLSSFALAENIPSASLEKLTRIDGTAFKAEKDKVLLYFWATWCPDCKDKLHNDFTKYQMPPNAQIVTVNTDKDIDRAKHYVTKESVGFTVVRDENREISKQLKVFSVPYWAVLQREGDSWKVVDSEAGGNQDRMKKAIGIN